MWQSGCRALSRSCSRGAATCPRSSVRSARTACWSASLPASTRSGAPAAAFRQRDMTATATTNGHGDPETAKRAIEPPTGVLGSLRKLIAGRVPPANLDERDPDYIRETLPRFWLLCTLWFRGEVRGLGNVPEEGPVLLVGNHSGGNLTPDTTVFTLAFSTYFGVERAFHQLAHNLVVSHPALRFLRKYGTVAASMENAKRALDAGAAVLVYPGGDYEVHRPSWERHRVDFGGRQGFIRLAIEMDVPIVPVVAVGGQETALFLPRGGPLAGPLGLTGLLPLKAFRSRSRFRGA